MSRSSEPVEPCAFLWDESFLWGLMAFNALQAAGLPFDLIRSSDIKNGKLRDYSMLFVPGGWASNKIKALGDEGVEEIRRFVNMGGEYLGFCGGAGLATLDGIGLLDIKRVPTKARVPSFSGRANFNLQAHDIWNGISESIFHVWWPSQFLLDDPALNVLATYKEALSDSYSSDLNVGDVLKHRGGWKELEDAYRINLDPSRLCGQPAVVEGSYGKGRVVLSLIHFDTPDDANGKAVMKNLWKYLTGAEARKPGSAEVRKHSINKQGNTSALPLFQTVALLDVARDLISFGERNFLWFRRNGFLLQWKRGIRGLEYCTLHAMIKALQDHAEQIPSADPAFFERISEANEMFLAFKEKAERLLFLERLALQDGRRMTYEKSDNPQIIDLRTELFANSKSYGGTFKVLLDKIDELLFRLLRSSMK